MLIDKYDELRKSQVDETNTLQELTIQNQSD